MSESSEPNAQLGSPTSIVDSWPVLEWVYGHEPVRAHFLRRLEAASRGELRLLISRINVGEITYNFIGKQRRGEIPKELDLNLDGLPWTVLSVDDELVDEAAELKSLYPISYADCFVAALGRRYNAPVITGDPDFLKLAALGVVTVDWLAK